ncbi:unknown protein [Seminavis robusta]|uniref:Uncharacterized protein n=1 Tax=Seminavis robusta TaxID=568900 RepID=A0A9N8EAC4_9STRA|nr:unknown protein [Seminavis robusta]|eukprot:Sro877_g214700.1 n/a (347) ;mRNA; r:42031-43247
MICGYDHIAHKHKIVCGQEQSPKDGEIYNVAMTMTVRKDQPNEEVLDLSKFTSKDVRALALKCGVRGGGNMTIFTARMEIARSIQMGTMYTDLSIANPGSDAAAGRKDYEEQPLSEQGVSGNPVKDFWLLVSDTMNETDDDSFDTVLGLQEGENDRLSAWNQENGFNLKDISRGHTFKTVKQHVCDLMKSRERCRMEMKKSVYYCDYLCVQQPAIDGKFAAFMDEDLKSDSTVDFTGSADSAGSKAGKLAVSAVVESLATATTDLKEAMSQRNNATEEVSQTKSWNDYFDVCDRYCKLKEDIRNGDSSKARMVGAMEVRIRQLEAHLKIVPAKSVIETEETGALAE